MCEEADFDHVHIDKHHRRARKEHACCACDIPIRKGDVYRASRAVYGSGADHRYDHYKHCLRCAKMLDAVLEARRGERVAIAWELNRGEDWHDTIGALPDDVAALAFMTADDAQQKLVPILAFERK